MEGGVSDATQLVAALQQGLVARLAFRAQPLRDVVHAVLREAAKAGHLGAGTIG